MYYPCSKSKGTGKLCACREAGLHLCFRIYANCWFSHAAALFYLLNINDGGCYICLTVATHAGKAPFR